MQITELIEIMKLIEPPPSLRLDSVPAKSAIESMGVVLSPEVEYFYIRYEGPHSSPYAEVELLDPCADERSSLVKANVFCREELNIPDQFIVISTQHQGSVFVLDTYSNDVFNVNLRGGIEHLLQGRIESVGVFGTFIRRFFLGSSH